MKSVHICSFHCLIVTLDVPNEVQQQAAEEQTIKNAGFAVFD